MILKVNYERVIGLLGEQLLQVNSKVFDTAEQIHDFYYAVARLTQERAVYYAPKDTGYLSENIFIEPDGSSYKVISKAPYSVWVHEDTAKHHEFPTRSKYLEDAAVEVYNTYKGIFSISLEIDDNIVTLYIDNPTKGSLIADRYRTSENSDQFKELNRDFYNFMSGGKMDYDFTV